MNIGDIIELENNIEYAILDIINNNDKNYLFAIQFKDETLNPENSKFFLEESSEEGYYVREVLDKEKIKELCVQEATQIKYNEDEEFRAAIDAEIEKIKNLQEDSN